MLTKPLFRYLNTLSYDQFLIITSIDDNIRTINGLLNISIFLSKKNGISYSLNITVAIFS